MQEIGGYLRGKIFENGLKVGAVQKMVGVAPNYIWRLETGKIKQPSIRVLKALTEAVRGQWSEVRVHLRDIPDLALADEESAYLDVIVEETPNLELAAILDAIRDEGKARPDIAQSLRDWFAGWRARSVGDRSR